MINDPTPISEADLHAFADGLLDPQRRAAVDEFLAQNPQSAAMVEDWRRQNAGIRDLFQPFERSRPGDEAMLAAKQPIPQPRSYRAGLWRAAAALVIFVAGAAAGQFSPQLFSGTKEQPIAAASLQDQARSAFLIYASDVRHPVEVGAAEQKHLAAWLGKRLDHPLTIPDLSQIGLNLVGGRLVPVSGKAGALLMYEDAGGRRVTVLVGRNDDNRETSFRFSSQGGVETFYWIDGPIGYAVTGDMSRERLQQVADECYRQFPG